MGEDQTLRIVNLIVSKLGMASAQVIPAYARYVYVDAWAYLVFSLIFLVLGYALSAFVWGYNKREGEAGGMPSWVVSVLIVVMVTVVFAFTACNQVAYIVAPEGYAVRQLIQDVRKGQ